MDKKALELERLEHRVRQLSQKGWSYDQIVEELSKPKHRLDPDTLGEAVVNILGPYPSSKKPQPVSVPSGGEEPPFLAQRVLTAWETRLAAPPEDKDEGGEEDPPAKKEKSEDKGGDEPAGGDDAPPPEDVPGEDEEGTETDKLKQDLDAREAMQPVVSILMGNAKKLRALSVKGLEITVNKDDVVHNIRVESKTPSGKDTYLELAVVDGEVQVRSRDYNKDGLLGADRPYEGDAVVPDQVDLLLQDFYDGWKRREVSQT